MTSITVASWVAGIVVSSAAMAELVPLGECPCDPPQSQDDPCKPYTVGGCQLARTWCDRCLGDPYVIDAGTPSTVIGETMWCRNCPTCCPNCIPHVLHCSEALSVSFSETTSFSISPGIGFEDQVKLKLDAAFGHQNARSRTFTVTCGTDIDKCWKVHLGASLDISKGVTLAIDATYTNGGVYRAHYGMTCCLEGYVTWSQGCGSITPVGTVSGDIYGDASCSNIEEGPC